MKTKFKSTIRAGCHSFGGVVCAGAVLLIASRAPAQNLFVSSDLSGNIYEFTPGGVQSPFASGLDYPFGLAFNSAGALFEADLYSGNIYEFTPGGVKSTFASGLSGPEGLAFNSTGDLFVANQGSGIITAITPGGVKSTFASGLNGPDGLVFNNVGDLFVANQGSGLITAITPGGVKSTFASGLETPVGLAFQPVPEPSALGLLAVGATALLVRRRRNLAADFNPDQKPSMPSNRNFRVIPRRLLAGLTVLVGCALAHGSTVSIVTPNGLTGTEGNIDNAFPFSVAETMRYQQVYAASQFGAIAAGGGMITAIAFRPDAVYGYAFTHTIANIQIDLSTTTAGPGGLSLTFANNVGANDTTVFNGSLTLSSAFTGPAGGPKNFDILIPLTTPFYYNPAAGNLLLDIRNFSSGNSGGNLIPQLDATSANPTLVGRVYAFDASATSAPYSFDEDTIGLVTQFTATPVPEPTTWGLLCVAALLVGRRGIRPPTRPSGLRRSR
jgi:sugar lactone lactonase YvrE